MCLRPPRHTWCTAACDVDNDGEPDLLTASYGRDFNTFWHGGFKGGDGSTRFVQHMHESHLDRDDNDDWTTNWNAQCYCHDNPTADECDKCGPPEVDCVQLKAAFGGIYRWNHPTDRKPYRLGGNTCLAGDVAGDYSFDQPLQVGDRIVFDDMIHYTMVKTTFFNGVKHPSIAHRAPDGAVRVVRSFGYADFKGRLG